MNNQNDKNQNNGGFFNKNPIFIFAIFAIVIVLAFRTLTGDPMTAGFTNAQAQSKTIAYSDFKNMVKAKQISEVAISEGMIRAVGTDKNIYVTRRVSDPTLVGLLEENGIGYAAYSDTNWFSELIFSWVLPVPGGPTSKIPFGIFAPKFRYLSGLFK